MNTNHKKPSKGIAKLN